VVCDCVKLEVRDRTARAAQLRTWSANAEVFAKNRWVRRRCASRRWVTPVFDLERLEVIGPVLIYLAVRILRAVERQRPVSHS